MPIYSLNKLTNLLIFSLIRSLYVCMIISSSAATNSLVLVMACLFSCGYWRNSCCCFFYEEIQGNYWYEVLFPRKLRESSILGQCLVLRMDNNDIKPSWTLTTLIFYWYILIPFFDFLCDNYTCDQNNYQNVSYLRLGSLEFT